MKYIYLLLMILTIASGIGYRITEQDIYIGGIVLFGGYPIGSLLTYIGIGIVQLGKKIWNYFKS